MALKPVTNVQLIERLKSEGRYPISPHEGPLRSHDVKESCAVCGRITALSVDRTYLCVIHALEELNSLCVAMEAELSPERAEILRNFVLERNCYEYKSEEAWNALYALLNRQSGLKNIGL